MIIIVAIYMQKSSTKTKEDIQILIKFKKYNESYDKIVRENIDYLSLNERSIWIEIGNYKFENDEYEEALLMYNESESFECESAETTVLNIAFCYQQLNLSHKALQYYHKYLSRNETTAKDVYCLNNIATIEYYNKNYGGALEMYSKLDSLHCTHLAKHNLYFNYGFCCMKLSHYKKALQYLYRNLKSTTKNRSKSLIAIAWIQSKKLKNYERAFEAYERLDESIVNIRDLEFDKAWTAQQLKKYSAALKYYKLYLRKHSNNANALHNTAWIYINIYSDNESLLRKGKQILIKLLSIDKAHFYGNYTYAIYLRDCEQNYSMALQCLQIANKSQANNLQIIVDIAKTYKFMHKFEEAKLHYLKAINLNKSDCYANMEYAHFLAIVGKYKLSDFYYKKVIKNIVNDDKNIDLINNINMVQNYTNYGHVLHKLNKNKEAINVVSRALLLNPNDTNTLNNLGYYNYVIGNLKESETYLLKTLALNPSHEFTNATYANLLFQDSKYQKAEVYFANAVKLKSDLENKEIGPTLLLNYATLLFKHKKDYKSALVHCTQFMALHQSDPNLESIYYLMANIYKTLSQTDNANSYLKKAMEFMKQN